MDEDIQDDGGQPGHNKLRQKAWAMIRIREMILQGEFVAGQRLPEALIIERLGISRTPVRQALPVLAEEGLLTLSATRGFVVRAFSVEEILEAIEVRGALEGLAARSLAERGAPRPLLRSFRDLLDGGDEIFAKRHLTVDDESRYSTVNSAFHALVVEAADRPILKDTLRRVNLVPFATPAAIAFDRSQLDRMYDLLWYAHRQHHEMVLAIEAGEGARVEALMREHVHTQKHSMNLRRLPVAGVRAA